MFSMVMQCMEDTNTVNVETVFATKTDMKRKLKVTTIIDTTAQNEFQVM